MSIGRRVFLNGRRVFQIDRRVYEFSLAVAVLTTDECEDSARMVISTGSHYQVNEFSLVMAVLTNGSGRRHRRGRGCERAPLTVNALKKKYF